MSCPECKDAYVETKENEGHAYGAPLATVLRQHHDQTLENATMDRNASYDSIMTEHTYEVAH